MFNSSIEDQFIHTEYLEVNINLRSLINIITSTTFICRFKLKLTAYIKLF